jgi:hypoxanthine phosphoribosyltransferase
MTIYTPIPQDRFVADIRLLAARLSEDAAWSPTFLIGIGRGGLVPAVFLSHASGLPMLSVDFSAQVEDFALDPIARLAARTRGGERFLFLDDINDTGRTIKRLRAMLAEAGAVPGSVRFATLLDNIRSGERVDYHAREIDRAVTKDWFIFPWEAVAPELAIQADAAAVPERTA